MTGLDTKAKKVKLRDGTEVPYEKLLIATGAESFIPPVGNLREADNVFGLRHLRDAVAIDEMAKNADRKSTRLNSSHRHTSRMPSSA